ncbi:MAG: RNA polymerase sigma-70 factor (ECF subfamily) [Planctomycetota bacterium]|jgi:RNA polymerase sigma-70 factor (ECF subfamily)
MERVRSLAGQIVRQAADQDDLVQEAVTRALAKPTTVVGEAGPWVRRVVRNLAIDRQRSSSRRQGRELSTVDAEMTQESTADSVARAECQRDMVDAVLKLKEPYRAVILARFFDGLPPREIAKRQGVPVATVKKHQERGMVMLRKELEGRYGGNGAWAVALLPILPKSVLKALGAKGLGVGAISVGSRWMILGAVALAGVSVSLYLLGAGAGTPRAVEDVVPVELSDRVAADGLDPRKDELDAPRIRSRATADSATASALAQPAAAAPRTFRGTFVDQAGEPVPGVSAQETTRPGTLEGMVFGSAAGAVALDLDQPLDSVISVTISAEGYAAASFRLPPVKDLADAAVDVGRQTLYRHTELRVRVLDGEGAVLSGWEMSYFHHGGGERLEVGRAAADPATGIATFRDLAAAHAEVIAEHPSGLSLYHPRRALAAGDAGMIDLVYLGPDPAAHVGVELAWPAMVRGAVGEPVDVQLMRDGEVAATQSVPLGVEELAFDGIPQGYFAVKVEDPRFQTVETAVEPGQSASLELEGNARVALTLRDAKGGAITDFAVELRGAEDGGPLVQAGEERLVGSELEGLVPGQALMLRAITRDGREAVAEVEPLAPMESRVLDLTLGEGVVAIRVRALRGQGELPVSGAEVALFGVEIPRGSSTEQGAVEQLMAPTSTASIRVLARGTTDRSGEATLMVAERDVAEAQTALTALVVDGDGAGDHGIASVVDGAARILLKDQGAVRVHVKGLPRGIMPTSGLPSGVAITLTWPGSVVGERATFGPGRTLTPAGDATFEVAGVPIGEASVWLALSDFNHTGRGTTLGGVTGPVGYPLGNLIVRAGAATTLEVDVAAVWPGRLELTASHAGLPLADAVVELEPVGSHAHLPYPFGLKKSVSRKLVRLSDGTGRVLFPRLPSGTWRIRVRDGDWLWSSDGGVCEIGPGEIQRLDIAVQLATAGVTLVDRATGEALASQDVLLEIAPGIVVTRRTDAAGGLRLRLGPGRYPVGLKAEGTEDGENRVPLVWDIDGPVEPMLRIQR